MLSLDICGELWSPEVMLESNLRTRTPVGSLALTTVLYGVVLLVATGATPTTTATTTATTIFCTNTLSTTE